MPISKKDLADTLLESLGAIGDSAVRALAELVVSAESEAVRLGAAKTVLDYLGVKPAIHVQVDQGENAEIDRATAETLEKLQRNVSGKELPSKTPSLEALLVLEGESDELPVGGPLPGHAVVEVTVSTS